MLNSSVQYAESRRAAICSSTYFFGVAWRSSVGSTIPEIVVDTVLVGLSGSSVCSIVAFSMLKAGGLLLPKPM